MTASITIRHNAEAAHRLPFLGGKCTNLHGHSWNFTVTIAGEPDGDGVLLEFASVKKFVRGWIDEYLDHGAMLGAADPLIPALDEQGSKVYRFDPRWDAFCAEGVHGRALPWPTVENVAELVRRVVARYLEELDDRPLRVTVTVTETAVNAATAS